MALGGVTHDISVSDGSTDIGYMLLRDKYGRPVYTEKEMSPLNFMQAAGYVDESSQNPQSLYPLAFQKSWVGGFGQSAMDSREPRRYLAAYGVDASEPGVMKLGPDWIAVNWSGTATIPTLTDGGLETWTSASNLTNWTEVDTGNGSIAQESTTVRTGTYSAKLTSDSLVADYVEINQTLSGWLNDFRSKRFRATCWVYQDTASKLRLSIYDGVGTTNATIATTGAWTQLHCVRELDAAATELTIKIRQLGTPATQIAYVDDVSISGYTESDANCYAEYDGLHYMSVGDILVKGNSATSPTGWTYVANFGAAITDLYVGTVSGTSYLFIMIGSGNLSADNGWYYDGTTVTQMTDGGGTDASGDYMTAAGTTLYIAGRPTGVTTGAKHVIRTNTAPLAGAWSADTVVGDTNTNITGLVTVNGVVYIAKEDSLWKVNSDGTVTMVVDYRYLYASTSGVGVTGWNNKVYVPCGTNSLIEYDPDSGTYASISPADTIAGFDQAQIALSHAMLSSIQADFDGRIMAVAGGADFLWILQDNGSVNNLFKGRYSNIDSVGWHWHPVANTTMADVNAMAVSSLSGSLKIWVAHGTGNPGYYDLTKYETSDPTYTNPCLLTPYYTGGVWRMMKALYSIILGLESITATVYITLQYRFYGTAAWSSALTFDGAAGTVSNGQDQNYMPADSFGTAIQFRINFISNSSSSTPKVTRINGEGVIKPSEVSTIQCSVLLTDSMVMRNGAMDTMPASTKRTALNTIRALNWPTTMYDIVGTSHNVDMILKEQNVAPIVKRVGNPEYIYDLILKKVTLA